MSGGAHPADARLFRPSALPALRRAVRELSWLLTRDYSARAALALVGDRYQLAARQREAVARCAVPDASVATRVLHAQSLRAAAGEAVVVDAFNALITVERGLAGAPVFLGRDGVPRDIAGVHGSWRRSNLTGLSLDTLGEVLAPAASVHWVIDRPVSNSGRLAVMIRARGWTAELLPHADPGVVAHGGLVVSGDGGLLDQAKAGWIPAVARALRRTRAWLVDLRPTSR